MHLNLLQCLWVDEALDGAPDHLEHLGCINNAGVTQHLRVVVLVNGHDPLQHLFDVPCQML